MSVGIDASVLVRLLTGEPVATAQAVKGRLVDAFKRAELVIASDVVIAEGYYALKYHYQCEPAAIRSSLIAMLTSGLIKPEPGSAVLDVLESKGTGKSGFVDRLIQARYERAGLTTLTVDKAQSRLGKAAFVG